MEPTFAASTSETVTAELRVQLDAAVAAIPHLHATNLSDNEVFQSKNCDVGRLEPLLFRPTGFQNRCLTERSSIPSPGTK